MKIRLFVLIAILSYCSYQVVFAQEVTEEQTEAARNLKPGSDKALVYIIRPSSLGFAIEMDIFTNNDYIGSTKGKNFIYCYLDPGETQFRVTGENTSLLNLTLEPDRIYYLHQKIHMGTIKARAELVPFDDEQKAKQKLIRCKLSKTFKEPQ